MASAPHSSILCAQRLVSDHRPIGRSLIGSQVRRNKLRELRPHSRSGLSGLERSPLPHRERGNAAHVEPASSALMGIGVDLDDQQPPRAALGERSEMRSDRTARTTPWSPEINQDGNRTGGDEPVELIVAEV